MSVNLPPVIAAYIQATNDHDTEATLACFAPDAIVTDDGQTMSSTETIKTWIDEVTANYRVTLDVTNVSRQDSKIVVTTLTSGNFDGSPFPFRYTFSIAGNRITRMVIEFAG